MTLVWTYPGREDPERPLLQQTVVLVVHGGLAAEVLPEVKDDSEGNRLPIVGLPMEEPLIQGEDEGDRRPSMKRLTDCSGIQQQVTYQI